MRCEKMKSPDEQLGIVTDSVTFKDPLQVLATLFYGEMKSIHVLASEDIKEWVLFIG